MASVELKNVFKKYDGGVIAVSDFTLYIEDKEFIILVGPSGCGKSTTLRMIAGLEEISEGQVFIGDRLVNDVQPKDRDIAMVFQNYALYPHMTVFDNMAFGLKLRKVPKDEIKRRVHEAARILEIEHLLDRKPKALSGGQRQRVALGRAIVREPKVFLLDEPLSNLDAKLRVQMRIEITKLHQRLQTTFIYVTHDQTEALTMGTRIVVMKDGFVQQVDSPLSLYDKPNNMFVAGFLGTPQINFFNSMLTEKGKDLWLTFNNTSIKLPPEKSTPAVREYLGKEVVMAVRPEAIRDDEAHLALSPDTKVTAAVEVVEMLGSETLLYLTIDGVSAIARVNPRNTAAVGDVVPMCFEASRIQIFDKDTEKVIAN
jgi:multiple sugar transport system ATP-binding protein